VVDRGCNGHYPKHHRYWELREFHQASSDYFGKVYYRQLKSGLALTEWGLKLQIKKALKKAKTSREAEVYSLTEFLG
jgi:hypothetical protein